MAVVQLESKEEQVRDDTTHTMFVLVVSLNLCFYHVFVVVFWQMRWDSAR